MPTTPMSSVAAPRPSSHGSAQRQSGVVLPIAMIMLVIFSFAGLLAARNSASYEQFSNNLRTNQIARQAAEVALRHCERVVIDLVDNEGKGFVTDSDKVLNDANKITLDTTKTVDENIKGGHWNAAANWVGNSRIEVTPTYSSGVKEGSKIGTARPKPSCIAQQLGDDRFIVTARGLSLDAEVDAATGKLTRGSEVWLQSILAPGIPVLSAAGGPK